MPAPMPAPSIAPVQDQMPPMDDTEIPPVDMDQPQDDEMPFGKEKFDAGIDVDEDADPKKYIEKLTGKLAQKLRDYNGTEEDIDLNKFVINSLIPASVPEMDETDAKDVIKKVQDNIGKSGQESGQEPDQGGNETIDNEAVPPTPDEESGQEELPQQQENKTGEIDDLINEILRGKSLKRNIKHKNPFESPKFK